MKDVASQRLTGAQRRNVLAYGKCHRELASLSKKLAAAGVRRRRALERVFDEIEKHPSRYNHVVGKGRARKSVPMTLALAKKLRRRMLQQQQQNNPHGGPGCDNCADIPFCWCAFKAPLLGCCYICLSPNIVNCI